MDLSFVQNWWIYHNLPPISVTLVGRLWWSMRLLGSPIFRRRAGWDHETSQTVEWSLLLDDSKMMPNMFTLVQTLLFMGESFVFIFFRVTMRFWTHPHFFHPVRCTWPCNILRCSVTLRPDGQPPPAAPATKPRNLHRLCRDRHPRDDRQAIAAMAAMAEWSHDAPRWLSRGRHRLIGLGWFGIRKLGPSLAMHVAKTSVESHQELIWEDGSRTC